MPCTPLSSSSLWPKANRPSRAPQVAKVLADMYAANINRPALGANDGLLLDWDTAASLGLVPPAPIEITPASIASRIQDRRTETLQAQSSQAITAPIQPEPKKSSGSSWQSPNQTKPWLARLTPSWFAKKK